MTGGQGPSSSAVERPLGEEPSPVVAAARAFLNAFGKLQRAGRVYATNNEMFAKLVDRAEEQLGALFELTDELDLVVREDRLLHAGEPVHEDADRAQGLPITLYRNAFRRLTFVGGMARDELVQLVQAINTDYGPHDPAGEDLVSTLWRLRLPHLRYVTLDAFGPARDANAPEANDLDDIQADIDAIVAAIYRTDAPDEDIVAGVSIGRADLESLAEVRGEPPEDLDRLETYTERAVVDLPEGQLARAREEAQVDDHDALTRRLLDVLLQILFKERSGSASSTTVELLQQLYDALLLAGRFSDARALVERLSSVIEAGGDIQEMHIAQHLLRLFASESRVLPVLEAFNDAYRTVSLQDLVAFLRALGTPVVETLLTGLEHVDAAAHRKVLCALIAELGVPDVQLLEKKLATAEWFVARDLLELARSHPLERITRLTRDALEHPHPKVRAQALRILRDYAPGAADELIASRLDDIDTEVRLVAARVSAARRSKPALHRLEAMFKEAGFPDRDPRELRIFLGAYATIGQGNVVRTLASMLHSGFFERFKNIELQLAAASALGLIPSESARSHLRKGARSLSGRLRDGCRRALNLSEKKTDDLEEDSVRNLLGPTFDLPTESESAHELVASLGLAGTEVVGDHQWLHRSGPAMPSVDVPYHEPDLLPEGTGELSLPLEPDRVETEEAPIPLELPSDALMAEAEPPELQPMVPEPSVTAPTQVSFQSSEAELDFDEAFESEPEAEAPSTEKEAAPVSMAELVRSAPTRPLTPSAAQPLDPSAFLTEDDRRPTTGERQAASRLPDLAADLFLDEDL